MLAAHDEQHGTSFTANYPGNDVLGEAPQNTRLGHESVICQRCHADNVIAVVKSANCGSGNELGTEPCAAGSLIEPITEAIHNNHQGVSRAVRLRSPTVWAVTAAVRVATRRTVPTVT